MICSSSTHDTNWLGGGQGTRQSFKGNGPRRAHVQGPYGNSAREIVGSACGSVNSESRCADSSFDTSVKLRRRQQVFHNGCYLYNFAGGLPSSVWHLATLQKRLKH